MEVLLGLMFLFFVLFMITLLLGLTFLIVWGVYKAIKSERRN